MVSIRPHNIKVKKSDGESKGTRNELTGVVQKVSYLGDRVDYRIGVGEQALRVQTEPGKIYAEGTKVLLVFPPDKISVIAEKAQ